MRVGEEVDMQVDQVNSSPKNIMPADDKPVNFGEPFLWGEDMDGLNLDQNLGMSILLPTFVCCIFFIPI